MFITILSIAVYIVCTSDVTAQQAESPESSKAEKYGVWNDVEDETGEKIQQMRLRVYPKAEPVPAFKHRLIPAAEDRVDGNSALFYLKAMGFFEQNNAREALTKLQRKWHEQWKSQGEFGDYAPHIWADATPESLPLDQVREYLELQQFQPEFLYDAARRTRFEHDRAMEREPNPIGYLLPSIQQHRELARVQNVRCRFAMAEGRIDDAVEIVGQMMAMGQHLGTDEFLVTSLVGVACHGIGVNAGFVLSQQPDTPNLYWALAACPKPAIDLSNAFANERNLLLLQMPMLKEVTEEIRPANYWIEFIKRFTEVRNDFVVEMNTWYSKNIQSWDHWQAVTAIARDYPDAREFLSQVVGLSDKQLDQYPKAQVAFLALAKYYQFFRDEKMKQYSVPYASRPQITVAPWMEKWKAKFTSDENSYLMLGDTLLGATEQCLNAATRAEQWQNLWQTVEALRMTAADNGGKLPASLEQLSVPAPLDPVTNQPFEYELDGTVATLQAAKTSSIKYQIKLELANSDQQTEKTK
jgi:hypothetical protein